MLSMHMPTPFALLDAAMADAMLLNTMPGCRIDNSQPRLSESETSYTLAVTAPGVKPEDVSITVEDGHMRVAGETVTSHHTHFVNFTIKLPLDSDLDLADATCVDGLLTVTLPKKAEAEPTTVTVSMSADDEETESESTESPPYKLTLVAAGLSASDLVVTASERGVLNIEGETKRTGSKIARSFKLPRDADSTLATACHVDGILTLTVPKKEAVAAKEILVTAGGVPAFERVASSVPANDDHAEDHVYSGYDMEAEPTKSAAVASDAEEDGVMV